MADDAKLRCCKRIYSNDLYLQIFHLGARSTYTVLTRPWAPKQKSKELGARSIPSEIGYEEPPPRMR